MAVTSTWISDTKLSERIGVVNKKKNVVFLNLCELTLWFNSLLIYTLRTPVALISSCVVSGAANSSHSNYFKICLLSFICKGVKGGKESQSNTLEWCGVREESGLQVRRSHPSCVSTCAITDTHTHAHATQIFTQVKSGVPRVPFWCPEICPSVPNAISVW